MNTAPGSELQALILTHNLQKWRKNEMQTKPKIDVGSLVSKVVDKIPQIANTASQATINEIKQPPKKGSTLQKLGGAALNVAKAVAPMAASFIPGVGPVVSKILSTLNDDEWFEEFTGNGATFNEYLKLTDVYNTYSSEHNTLGVRPTGAIASITTYVNKLDSFWEDYMSSVLAYVRSKTNNVLVDDTTKYTDAFVAAISLYAVYYNIGKLIKLSEKQPLNIPTVVNAYTLIKPTNYAQTLAIHRSLEEFLKTSIKLPYALTSYLRWRFGTIFHSDNTGKPGLIMYDFCRWASLPMTAGSGITFDTTVAGLVGLVDALKNDYVQAGRAGADIKLAYEDHSVIYNVEDPHYDEKEFNLRSNCGESFTSPANAYTVILDSRLDMNAAIQAVTISTTPDPVWIWSVNSRNEYGPAFASNNLNVKTPFPTVRPRIAFYMDASTLAQFRDTLSGDGTYPSLGNPNAIGYTSGWNFIYPQSLYAFAAAADTQFLVLSEEDWMRMNTATAPVVADYKARAIRSFIEQALMVSLQLHNRPVINSIEALVAGSSNAMDVQALPLSYDMATLTRDSLNGLQRSAMRNLIRGNYKNKKNPVTPELKSAVAETVDVLTPSTKELAASVQEASKQVVNVTPTKK